METPTLCKKHFAQVANHFDRELALQYELDGPSCVICAHVINLEMARRFAEQHQHAQASPVTYSFQARQPQRSS